MSDKAPAAQPAAPQVPRAWVAVWVGSGLISGHIGAWIAGGWAARLLALLLAAGFIKGLPTTTWICCTAAGAWLCTAIILGLRETKPDDEEEDAKGKAPAADKKQLATLDRDAVAALLHGLLREEGGVHLKSLAGALPGGPRPTREARALLARVGIRVRAGVRVPGVGGREGVHRDDIPSPASPVAGAPVVGVVSAGESNNNNNGNKAATFTVIDDPVNPHHAHVHHSAPRAH